MKSCLPLLALGLSLAGCQHSNKEQDAVPARITSAFNQDFTLAYRQQATLPATNQSELTVELNDLHYSICPKDARCFGANFVFPMLVVTDAQGRTQQLKLPVNHTIGLQVGAFIDTASIQANGQRYLVQYTNWKAKDTGHDYAQKQDLSVVLRVTQLGGN